MKSMEQKIEAIFSKWQQGLCPGGQVAVRRGGELIYYQNFGYANLEYQVPVKNDTVFHVASVSKQITVMCVLLLQEDGKLNIDNDVRDYLPEYINFEKPVSVRQMINNVSGIRDQWELLALSGVRIVDTITQRDALSIIKKQRKLNFEPQSQYLYSNSNFTLLAEIVEKLSGKTLNEFADERIFRPLGMENTFFKENYWKVIPNIANSYFDIGDGQFVYSVLNYGTYGATSLNTTATDFLKWMQNFNKPTICSDKTLSTILENPTLSDGTESSYTGGLFIGNYKGYSYIEHGGADAAYRSAMLRFTDEDIDIVVFSNTQNMLMKDAAFAIADVMLGMEEPERTTDQIGEYTEVCDLAEIEGYYFPVMDTSVMTFDISYHAGTLYVKNQYGFSPLTHISGNHFRLVHFDYDFYFGDPSILKIKDKIITLKKLTPYKALDGIRYLGCYESSELDTTYKIIDKEGILNLSHFRNGDHPLYQIDDHTFITEAHFTYIVNFLEEGERMIGFKFNGGRVKEVELIKVN